MVSMFPSQIAWVCKHPNLEAFDTTSVRAITTGGSTINPIYERMIYDKFVNLSLLRVVTYDTISNSEHKAYSIYEVLWAIGNWNDSH